LEELLIWIHEFKKIHCLKDWNTIPTILLLNAYMLLYSAASRIIETAVDQTISASNNYLLQHHHASIHVRFVTCWYWSRHNNLAAKIYVNLNTSKKSTGWKKSSLLTSSAQ